MPFFFESDPDPNLDFVKKKTKIYRIHSSKYTLRQIVCGKFTVLETI